MVAISIFGKAPAIEFTDGAVTSASAVTRPDSAGTGKHVLSGQPSNPIERQIDAEIVPCMGRRVFESPR